MRYAVTKQRPDLIQWFWAYCMYFLFNLVYHYTNWSLEIIGLILISWLMAFLWASIKTYKLQMKMSDLPDLQKKNARNSVFQFAPIGLLFSSMILIVLGILIVALIIMLKIFKKRPLASTGFLSSNVFTSILITFGHYLNAVPPEPVFAASFLDTLGTIQITLFLVTSVVIIVEGRLLETQRELKATNEHLIDQAQIESIQQLAAGFSHDFNNLLMGILGNVELMQNEPNIPSQFKEYFQDMQSIILHAKNLSNQLMALARNKREINQTAFNITQLISTVKKFSLVGRLSQCIIESDDKDLIALGDPIQISQVVQNLLINADQSMQKGGIIRIKIQRITINERNQYNLAQGGYIRVDISDQGVGISPSVQNNIFKPFFTTKSTGTGLGLTICKSIINNHHGLLNFTSIPEKGTTFYFLIPEGKNLDETQLENVIEEKKFSGTVVILEDNLNILALLESMIQSFGLESIGFMESTTFLRKVELLVKEDKEISLFIIDIMLAGDIHFRDLLKELRRIVPNAYVIASSGYSRSYIEKNYADVEFQDLLHKPYTRTELYKKLQKGFSAP
jgi:signal transduction histidine kinase/CheY-like chemotaxis protein